jgi:DNA-binding beta-propeller fold protein YncE
MNRAWSALGALIFLAASGEASAQQQACPTAASLDAGPAAGNASSANKAMNADTDLPPDSPLAGLPHPYRQDDDWAKMPAGRIWGDARAIDVDRDGKSVWVVDRCGLAENACARPSNKDVNPIMHFDHNGKLLKSFGAGMFADPHGVRVDKNGNVWTADGNNPAVPDGCPPIGPAGNMLREWSPNGKLLMTISGPQGGKPFTGLTDVVISPVTGDIFVGDGHGRVANMRIIKFDRHGKYLTEWGSQGPADNQIGIPHGLAMDKEGRIYVADRTDKKVKVYDQKGKLLHAWTQFGTPAGVFVDKHDMLYVADETANNPDNPKMSPGVRIASVKDGKIVANIPYRPGNAIEGVAVDDAGNVYAANTNHPRAVRWLKTAR